MKRFSRVSCVAFFSILCIILACTVFHTVSNAQSQKEEWDRAAALFNEGQKSINHSDFRGAIERWEAALSIVQKLGQKKATGVALGNLGIAYSHLGDYRKAISYHEQAMAIAEEIGDKQGKGSTLNNLGNAYNDLGDYRKAISYYERALKIAEAIGAQNDKGAIIGNLGNAYNALGDYRKAISYHEQSLAIAEEIGDKQGKGSTLNNLGNAYNDLGDYRKAISYYEQSLAIAEESGNKQGKVNTLGNLGLAYNDLGDYRKAISYHEQAMAIAEEIGNKKGKGIILGNLGNAYSNLGDYRKAISHYEQALKIAGEVGDKQNKGKQLGNLGNAYSDLGDYRKAVSHYEQALKIAEEIGDKRTKGACLGNLGLAYSNLGDFQKAIGYYEQAIAADREIGVPWDIPVGNLADALLALDHDDDAFAFYTIGGHSVRLGRYYLKKKNYQKAKGQFDRDREQDEQRKQSAFIIPRWIGLGLSHEGLREYDAAYGWYTRAIAFMEEQRSALTPAEREHYFEGKEFGIPRIEAYEGAVRCAYMLNLFDEAFYWAENTRGRIFSELLSRRHEGEGYKIPPQLAQEEEELTTQIMINKRQQQTAFEKNNPELLKKLEEEYPELKEKMDRLIDRLRREYPQYASIRYPQPVKLSQLALRKGETIIEYEVTEPYTMGLVIRDGKVVKGFRVEKTRAELEVLVNRFRSPFQKGHDINEFSLILAKEMADLFLKPALQALRKGERIIIIPDEALSLIPYESLLLSAPLEVLREEATVLAQAKKQTDEGIVNKSTIIRGLSHVPITRGSSVTVPSRVTTHILFDTGSSRIRKESQKQLSEIVSALKSAELKNASVRIEGHTDSTGDPKFNLRLSLKRAHEVKDYLVRNGIQEKRLSFTGKGDTEPIADNATDKGKRINRRVVFVRATDQTALSPLKGLVYAVDDYHISYYQSASVLSLHRGLHIDRAREKTFFGLGDPIYDTQDKRSAGLRAVTIVEKKPRMPSKDTADLQDIQEAGYAFSRLINTEKEVKEVGKLFPQSIIFTGADASEEKVKKEDLTSRRYILFSTHGILGNEIPYIKQPALVLNLVGNDREDGYLTATEIFNMNLNADLVGLSACKTGLGVQSAGEGVVGLSRAFMYAGTDSVLVSLWSVADESTYKLMANFFDGLKNGKDKLTALNDAKNYLRKNGYDHPFYWAPFILMGEAN